MRASSEEIRLIITDCKDSSRKRFTVKVFTGSPFRGGYKLQEKFTGGGSYLRWKVERLRATGMVVCVNFKLRERHREVEVTPVGREFAEAASVAVNLILSLTGSSRDRAGVVKSGEIVYARREEVTEKEKAYRDAGCAITQNLCLRKKRDGTETLCRVQGASRRVQLLKPTKDFELDKIWNAGSKDFTNFLNCGKKEGKSPSFLFICLEELEKNCGVRGWRLGECLFFVVSVKAVYM